MSDRKKAAKTLASRAQETAEAARARGEDLVGEARETVEDFATSARARVGEEAEAPKAQLADGLGATADRLATAADEMTADAPHTDTVAAAAVRLDGMADAVRDLDLGAVPARLSAFARKNPAAFLGGAAILGIAVGRFLKAQAPEDADTGPDLSRHHIPAPDAAPGGTTPA